MCRYSSYISDIRVLLIVFYCLVVAGVSAQEIDSTYKVDTTTIVEPPLVSEDEAVNRFDTVSVAGKAFPAYTIADTTLNRLKKDEDFWYANMALKKPQPSEKEIPKYKEPFYRKQWFRTLVWVIIVGSFIGVLIWFLIASDVKLFRRKAKKVDAEGHEDISHDIFSISYEQEIEKAISANNYRSAIRLFYLHTLRLMADREIIQYKPERTNSAYLLQLHGTGYYKKFFRLTRQFEYTWYGKFNPAATTFATIQQEYNEFKSSLSL
jgi:hypothetical protein